MEYAPWIVAGVLYAIAFTIALVVMVRVLRTITCDGEQLDVFEFALWQDIVRVAAMNVDQARHLLTERHYYGGAWMVSSKVVVRYIGRDSYDGWEKRLKAGGGIIAIASLSPQPHVKGSTELIEARYKENQNK